MPLSQIIAHTSSSVLNGTLDQTIWGVRAGCGFRGISSEDESVGAGFELGRASRSNDWDQSGRENLLWTTIELRRGCLSLFAGRASLLESKRTSTPGPSLIGSTPRQR